MNELALFAGAGGGFSVDTYLTGLRSARSSSKNTHAKSCCNDSETASSRRSRSGTTSAHLTGLPGEGSLTLSPEDSRARTSAVQEEALELRELEAGCGRKCSESFARFDRVSRSWKTHQCSLLGDLEPYSETWPKRGIMLHGWCWEPLTSELRTAVTEYGFLEFGTPTATMRPRSHEFRAGKRLPNPAEVAEMEIHRHLIPTPTACNAPNAGANTHGPKGLLEVARTNWLPGQKWLTPMAQDGMRSNLKLESLAKHWEHHPNSNLAEQVAVRELVPTPTCQDAKNNGSPSQKVRNTPPLNAVAGGALNPPWVEWLMGWPIGWTDLKPLEMDKYHSWLQQHSQHFIKY